MTRFSLRFDADGPHEAKSLEFERADGSFLFWLEETVDGREFEVAIDMGTPSASCVAARTGTSG